MSLYCVKRVFMAHSLMNDRSPQDQDKYIVRFPPGMRERLKQDAAKNARSLNAEIVKRLQDTIDHDDNSLYLFGGPDPGQSDDGLHDHLKSHPTPSLAAKETLDTILDELRVLRSSIIDVRHLPDGRSQVEFAPATSTDDAKPLPDPAPMPAKDDPGRDEAMLKQIEKFAERYGFELVKKK